MQPDRLRMRILLWGRRRNRHGPVARKSGSILEAVLYRGELASQRRRRRLVGTGERQARRIVSALLEKGVLLSDSPRSPHCVWRSLAALCLALDAGVISGQASMNKARLVRLSPRSVASARGVGRGRFLRRSRGHAADSGAVRGQGWVRRTRAAQISMQY